ncbi:MAG: carbonic anhydrase [Kineosporiaceae bacterium]|nr:carbonic anhydrase [Kineosporiaceae bacterium]MBK7622759.1 carbonic anhydrase [Kineosporiaceae bacterium]MBK8078735.1 carbonic anhydrase [Kineosporiaceae bacterium]
MVTDGAPQISPARAWAALARGNERFVAGRPEHPNQDQSRRADTAGRKQTPFAVVFGCMDSRVAAEIVFDRGLGDLAVIRTAGHVVDSSVLGSLEFGVVALGIPLVVVLGHDQCGAIAAAMDAHTHGTMPRGYLREIVERLTSSLVTTRQGGRPIEEVDAMEVMEQHVRHTVHLIAERSTAIAERIADGRCAIAGADYCLNEGRVQLLDAVGDLGPVEQS